MSRTQLCIYIQSKMKCSILINFRMYATVCKDCEIMIIYKTISNNVTSSRIRAAADHLCIRTWNIIKALGLSVVDQKT